MNNKGADQAVRMLRLVWAFVVRKPLKTGFLATKPIYEPEHKILILIVYVTAPSPIGPIKQFFSVKF